MANAKIISVINYKGGVGKTTTTYHIGCSLAFHHNKKVLLVDIDPQTNLTFLCASPERWQEQKKKIGTIADMYKRFVEKKAIDTKRYVWKSPIRLIPKLDLIPCDVELLGEDIGGGQISGTFRDMDTLKRQAKEFLREWIFLKILIREVDDKYDYIIIDCPPNLYLMTQNALVASHWYVISAIPDHLSTIGLQILRDKVKKIGERIKKVETFSGEFKEKFKVAELGGVIFVKVRIGGSLITVTHDSTMTTVGRLLGPDYCFGTYTTDLIGFSEAAERNLPIWLCDTPNAHRASRKQQYQEITNEFLRRF
jgi:chromosome partitioning protein